MHGRQKQLPIPIAIGGKDNFLTMENIFSGYISVSLDKYLEILQE